MTYENLEEWLNSKANSAEIHYIRVTDIPESALNGNPDILKAGNLGQILKESGKKVFIQIELENGKVLKEIGDFVFYDVKNLAGIELPEGLTSIGTLAFSGCSGLTSISIPEGLTSIGDRAFEDCSGLTSIDLSNCSNLTSIGEEAFYGCSGLTSIDLSNCSNLTSIGGHAFCKNEESYCKEVIVPNEHIKKLVMHSLYPEERIKLKK